MLYIAKRLQELSRCTTSISGTSCAKSCHMFHPALKALAGKIALGATTSDADVLTNTLITLLARSVLERVTHRIVFVFRVKQCMCLGPTLHEVTESVRLLGRSVTGRAVSSVSVLCILSPIIPFLAVALLAALTAALSTATTFPLSAARPCVEACASGPKPPLLRSLSLAWQFCSRHLTTRLKSERSGWHG